MLSNDRAFIDAERPYHDEHEAEGREFDERCGFCRPELAVPPIDAGVARNNPAMVREFGGRRGLGAWLGYLRGGR